MSVRISMFLDDRRERVSNDYPVFIRLYHGGKNKLHRIIVDNMPLSATREQFDGAYNVPRPKKQYVWLADILHDHEANAKRIIKSLKPFTHEAFKRDLYRGVDNKENVIYCYIDRVCQLYENEQIGTADNYHLSLRSLIEYRNTTGKDGEVANLQENAGGAKVARGSKGWQSEAMSGKVYGKVPLLFSEITVPFLKSYEKWMLGRGKSITTVGIYLRPLRAIFKDAIENNIVEQSAYPFGGKKYNIPKGKKGKKNQLDMAQLGVLFSHPVQAGTEQEKAKDFFFFSYICNGMNVKDYAEAKYKQITFTNEGQAILTFYRAKIVNTTKTDPTPITAILTADALAVIDKYGNADKAPDNYIFNICNKSMSPIERKRAVSNFTRYINQHLKLLAKSAGIEGDISTGWGRYSYATNVLRENVNISFVSEALGHHSINTTMRYLGGWDNKQKIEIANKVTDFKNIDNKSHE